ncbi:unnamed protein product [Cylicostephanus goldi]|uniref:Uncharacterized protein n=1 Tax=Cylicostephanus goldi TaxID=71465 RepID=A0A3P6S6I9_CYLGO|nr:unnamed protein product [Cylicostephanus goldi]
MFTEIIELPEGVDPQDVSLYECISNEEASREIVKGVMFIVLTIFNVKAAVLNANYYRNRLTNRVMDSGCEFTSPQEAQSHADLT